MQHKEEKYKKIGFRKQLASHLHSIFSSRRVRFISSVVPDTNLKDFGIENGNVHIPLHKLFLIAFSFILEPILSYEKGSKERKELIEALEKAKSTCVDVPIVIAGEEIRNKDVHYQTMPHVSCWCDKNW